MKDSLLTRSVGLANVRDEMQIEKRREKGFTLVDMLIVVAVLAVLATVAILAIIGVFGRGTEEALATETDTIQTGHYI